MNLLAKIKSFLGEKTAQEIRDFEDRIKLEFGFEDFLYVTSEGLPITGTFENCEEMAAFLPEILKALSKLGRSSSYVIKTGDSVYTITKITHEIIFLGKGNVELNPFELKKLVEISEKELGLI